MTEAPKRSWRIVHSETSTAWGGQERRILAELTGFKKRGCTVALLAPTDAGIHRRARAADIQCAPLSEARLAFPWTVLRTAVWLRRFRPDVVNPHSSRDGWTVGLAARLAGVPLIIRSRHFDVAVSSPWLSRHAYASLCHHVITTSPKIAREFGLLFQLPQDRITAIPTGIDLDEFSPTGPAAKLELPATDGPLIGMIGVIRLAKGHVVLLEAARQLCESGFPVRCVFVGDGPYHSAVEARVRELNLADRVLFTGHRDDVPSILRALSLVAMPSLHEAVPQVALQALATGTPVVASNVGGLPEIVRPGETGRLCPPKDATALAKAIRETIDEPAATCRMCEQGRAMIQSKYSLDGMLDMVETIYLRYLKR